MFSFKTQEIRFLRYVPSRDAARVAFGCCAFGFASFRFLAGCLLPPPCGRRIVNARSCKWDEIHGHRFVIMKPISDVSNFLPIPGPGRDERGRVGAREVGSARARPPRLPGRRLPSRARSQRNSQKSLKALIWAAVNSSATDSKANGADHY
ncbi:hypothetical protein EVAR_82015_1 [Eumeta japonica]|uniref:Uncharacterized protein n=1 Tax=Eumeta variegata TaxID=151549 RepID=A0A4C1VXK9_EUMVA|nr:hypothetical protein EVAR_82015_1 [Eumeta japonica]